MTDSLSFVESGSGTPALFIHGFPLDHRMWLDQLEELAEVRHCIAPDLPGFGSSAPLDEFTMDNVADALAAFIGSVPVDVVSLSMGGYVTFALWERHPELVRSLALLDTKATADTPAAREGRVTTAATIAREGVAALVPGMLTSLLAQGATVRAKQRLTRMIEATPNETAIAATMGMANRPDRTHVLSTISVPTMVLVGASDTVTPPAGAVSMAARISDATLSVVPGAGHLPPIETPDLVSESLHGFFTNH
jgi:3-oxoadipate enol-lactonase